MSPTTVKPPAETPAALSREERKKVHELEDAARHKAHDEEDMLDQEEEVNKDQQKPKANPKPKPKTLQHGNTEAAHARQKLLDAAARVGMTDIEYRRALQRQMHGDPDPDESDITDDLNIQDPLSSRKRKTAPTPNPYAKRRGVPIITDTTNYRSRHQS
jgi:hypothetical protein